MKLRYLLKNIENYKIKFQQQKMNWNTVTVDTFQMFLPTAKGRAHTLLGPRSTLETLGILILCPCFSQCDKCHHVYYQEVRNILQEFDRGRMKIEKNNLKR
jgi:hypothetical protein